MSTEILGQREMLENSYSTQDTHEAGTPEAEVERLRAEISTLRQDFEKRASRTEKLVGAYKTVLSDMADLIEAQRLENVKREESVRFFMSSAEARIKAEILEELGVEEDESEASGQSWWPFRKLG